MKKTIFILALLAVFTSCSKNYRVKTMYAESPNKEIYNFPILEGGEPTICETINNRLTSLYLNLEMGDEKESLFERVWSADINSLPERTDLNYQVFRLDKKLYSVNITGMYVGAYLNPINDYRNFDLTTGEEIYLDTLFTKRGVDEMSSILCRNKKSLMSQKIKLSKEKLEQADISMNDREYYAEMYDLYNNCSSEIESLDFVSFYVRNDSLFFVVESCALHYNQAVDEIGNFEYGESVSKLHGKLSNYGKHLLN